MTTDVDEIQTYNVSEQKELDEPTTKFFNKLYEDPRFARFVGGMPSSAHFKMLEDKFGCYFQTAGKKSIGIIGCIPYQVQNFHKSKKDWVIFDIYVGRDYDQVHYGTEMSLALINKAKEEEEEKVYIIKIPCARETNENNLGISNESLEAILNNLESKEEKLKIRVYKNGIIFI